MDCPRCSRSLDAAAPACPSCATALEFACDQCGHRSSTDAAFCAGCGHRLSALVLANRPSAPAAASGPARSPAIDPFEGHRRTVTIVMSDLSGYTAMCEKFDPEVISEIMGTIKREGTAIIESYGGTVNQFYGDEIVSLFGLPTAGADDARRAVSAALALHERVARMNETLDPAPPVPLSMHTGIHTGLLVVEVNDHRDGVYGLTGDAINTAARVLGIAERDEVIIGAPTRDAVEPYFEIEAAGLHTVRNKAQPLAVYRVLRDRKEFTRFDAARERGLTAMAGRDDELALLDASLRACRGGSGRVVIVEADAGTGKSRLAYEFAQRARDEDPRVLIVKGRCQAFGTNASYLPFIQVIREILDIEQGASVDHVLAAVPRAVAALDPDLEPYVAAYLLLLGAASVKDLPTEWLGDAMAEHLHTALVDLVIAVARQRPTIVQLDDWHWADEESHATLVRLRRAIADCSGLVLVSQRPGAAAIDGDVEVIRLGPLSPTATTSMIAHSFGAAAVNADLAATIFERTNGNPFFIEEVCAALRGQGRVRAAADQVVLTDEAGDLVIPDTVQAVVLGRVDGLDADAQSVLKVASVIGREFAGDILSQVAEVEHAPRLLTELCEAGFIEQLDHHDADTTERFRFRHIITQEVTYDTLLLRERRVAHARIAEAIEQARTSADIEQRRMVEALAHHHQRAGHSDRALTYFELAGNKAAERRALAEARFQLRSAIDESYKVAQSPAVREHRGQLTLRWAATCIFMPSLAQVDLLDAVMREALDHGNDTTAVMASYWINWIQYSIGNQRLAEEGTRQLLSLVEPTGSARTVALVRCHLGQILLSQARHDEAEAMLIDGLDRPPGVGASTRRGDGRPSGLYCYSLAQLALTHAARGAFRESRPIMDEALELVRATHERSTEASLNICAAIAALYEGDWLVARARIAAIDALPDVSVSPYVRMVAACVDGYAMFRSDGSDEGLRALRRSTAMHENADAQLALALTRAWLADALLRSGDHDGAAAMARATLERAAVGDNMGADLADEVLLQTSGLTGNTLAARANALAARRAAAGNPLGEAAVQLAAARAHLRADEVDEAARRAALAEAGMIALGASASADVANAVLRDALAARELRPHTT